MLLLSSSHPISACNTQTSPKVDRTRRRSLLVLQKPRSGRILKVSPTFSSLAIGDRLYDSWMQISTTCSFLRSSEAPKIERLRAIAKLPRLSRRHRCDRATFDEQRLVCVSRVDRVAQSLVTERIRQLLRVRQAAAHGQHHRMSDRTIQILKTRALDQAPRETRLRALKPPSGLRDVQREQRGRNHHPRA